MSRTRCIHDELIGQCPICRHIGGLVNQNTMVGARVHAITFGIRSSDLNRAMINVYRTQPSSMNGIRRIPVTQPIRNSARAYLNSPSMRTATRLRESLLVAITPQNSLLNFYNSGSVGTMSTTSTGTPRFSRSALTVYSRLGSPSTPTSSPRDRRARSATPMSTLRPRARSPSSNENNANRFSPPKKKQRKN